MALLTPTLLAGNERSAVVCAWLAGLGIACFLGLNIRYAWSLDRRPRSASRARGDRTVARWGIGYLAAGLVLSLVGTTDWLPQPSWTFEAGGIPLALPVLAVWAGEAAFLSNMVDWYWMRAWRDGVTTPPPCVRDGGGDHWLQFKNVTRIWIAHRWIAALSWFAMLMVNLSYGWVAVQSEAEGNDWVLYFLGIASPLALTSIVMGGYLKPLALAPFRILSHVPLIVGDVATFRLGDLEEKAMLHEVSMDQGLTFRTESGQAMKRPFADIFTLESVEAGAALSCDASLCRSLDGLSGQPQPCEWGSERLGPIVPPATLQPMSQTGSTQARSILRKTRAVSTPSRWLVW